MAIRGLHGLPQGALALVTVRFLQYLGLQAAYFIGIIGTLTYQLAADTTSIAVTVGMFNLGILIGNALGGSLLDRYGIKLHSVATLAVTVSASLLFQLAEMTFSRVFAFGGFFGIAFGMGYMFLTAYPAYLTSDAAQLKRVNALLSVASNIAVAVGPALGGFIALWLPSQRVFLATAAFSIVSIAPAASLLRVASGARRALDEEAGGAVQGRGTFADSGRLVFSVPSLALLFTVGVLSYAGYGAFDPLESLYYRDVLDVDVAWMGWLSSAAGVGSVIGAALALNIPRRWVNVRTLMVLIAFEGVGCLLYVGTPFVLCAMVGQVLLGAAFGMVTPLQNTLVQLHAPLKLLGRVNSVMNVGFNGAGVLPLLAAPALASVFGVQGVLVGASCLVFIVPVACLIVLRRRVSGIVAEELKTTAR